jgi:hypothetical protein
VIEDLDGVEIVAGVEGRARHALDLSLLGAGLGASWSRRRRVEGARGVS